ncbi:MAG: CoA transferase [Marinobacter sp.]
MSEVSEVDCDVYQAIAGVLDRDEFDLATIKKRLKLTGLPPEFDTHHKLNVAITSAIGAYSLTVEKWWHAITGQHQSINIDYMQAAAALNPGYFQRQSGYLLPSLSLSTELKSDFYRTLDDRWFFPLGSFSHLRDGVLRVLDSANTPEALAAAISKWKAIDLEGEFAKEGLAGVFARTTEEWRKHPQGSLLAAKPVIEIEKIADSDAEGPRGDISRPLQGVRVLDFGHVIAGPVVARTLAEQGAEILRISPPKRQDPFRQTIDTNIGKHSAFADLNEPLDYKKVMHLIGGADVVVQSWRPGSLSGRGLGAEEAATIRPGVIYVSVSAYGDEGPWAKRGGFEQLGQVASGIAVDEGAPNNPRLVPTYLLNDYLAGYLGATGAMLALLRRAKEGGSYHVKVSLTRSSMWTQDLGLITPKEHIKGQHFATNLNPIMEERNSAYGVLKQLPPVAQFSHTSPYWTLPPAPNGAHALAWLKR